MVETDICIMLLIACALLFGCCGGCVADHIATVETLQAAKPCTKEIEGAVQLIGGGWVNSEKLICSGEYWHKL